MEQKTDLLDKEQGRKVRKGEKGKEDTRSGRQQKEV